MPEANLTLGELHVSYTVKLRKPRIFSGVGRGIRTSIFMLPPGTASSTGYPTDYHAGEDTFGPSSSALTSLLSGQQNMLDCKVESYLGSGPLGPKAGVKIILPAYLSGDYELTFRLGGYHNMYTNLLDGNSRSYAPTREFFGNVVGIKDMFPDFATASGAPLETSAMVDTAGGIMVDNHDTGSIDGPGPVFNDAGTVYGRIRFRTTIADSGVDNAVVFYAHGAYPSPTSGSSNGPPTITQMFVELRQYNTGLNSIESDKPVYVDRTGQEYLYKN